MYSQTMAARFDCKKLLRFALATLCLLALAMFMPVAVNAADATQGPNETAELTISDGDAKGAASVFFKRKGSADEDDKNTGHAYLEVYVLQDNGSIKKLGDAREFKYQYNSHIDSDLYDNYDPDTNSFKPNLTADDPQNKKKGAGTGGYASLDLGVKVSDGYTLYGVEYTVCYSSKGPTNTGWKDNADFTGDSVEVKRPTQYYYLDNITDGTLVKVYIMPTYTIKYEVKYGEHVIDADAYSTYFTVSSGSLDTVTGYPQNGVASVGSCAKLTDMTTGMTKENFTENEGNDSAGTPRYTPKIYPYHRWCTEVNEEEAVGIAKNAFDYTTTTSVTLPTLTANSNYKVSGWSISGDTSDNTYNGGKPPMSVADLARIANNRVITLTAVVENETPNTDNSGNNNGNGDNGGNNNGDNNNNGNNNNNGGDSGDNGGQESTTTPAPETTPAPTASVTTVTAVAPTATPTATPAPTAEPTATPAPAAVSAHIPQTSDDMPYTLLVVTALASLCAAGALFMKRRSK